MSLDGLNSTNPPWKIDHPNYTSLQKEAIKLDDILQDYFKKILIEDVIYESCSLVD